MDEAISLENVSKVLNGREILKSISFSVKAGDIFGYLGPNGAGKTTTIRTILGLFKPNSGKVDIIGKSVENVEVRMKFGFVLEADGLYDNLTAYENLEYYCEIYDVTKEKRKEKIEDVLKTVGLSDRSKDKVAIYSKGMRQKLALARAMVHDPEILILDEPTAGIDPTGQIEVRQIILDLSKKGKTIFFSSHNLDEVQRICNRIALIHHGEIKLQGELDKLEKEMGEGKVEVETAEEVSEDSLQNLDPHFGLEKIEGKTLTFSPMENVDVADIVSLLTQNGIKIESVKRKEASLEEIYTALVKEAES